MKEHQIKKIIAISLIMGLIGLAVFYLVRSHKNNLLAEQLSQISGLSKDEISFLIKNGLIDSSYKNREKLSLSDFKTESLIEQNFNYIDESFEILASKFKKNTYKLAFRLENKSEEIKDFYLVVASEKNQAEFKGIVGFFRGDKGVLAKNRQNPSSLQGRNSSEAPSNWDFDTNAHKQELIPKLAQAYGDIEKNNYEGKPIKLTLNSKSTLIGVSTWRLKPARPDFIEQKMLDFDPSFKPIYLLVYGSAGGAKEEFKILNIHSYPQAGDNWTIEFIAKGKGNLRITPIDKKTINDLEFVSLKCGDEVRIPEILEEDVIFYRNWDCQKTAQIIYYVNIVGKHTLKFQFGGLIDYAYNNPSSWLTGYSYRKQITIDNSQISSDGTSTDSLSSFPLLVHFSNDTDVSGHAQNDGDDIRFTASDGETLLNFEEEYFNIDSTVDMASGWFWINIPTINGDYDTSSNDTIFMYYGNAGASDGQNVEAVWDTNHILVHHLTDSTVQSVSDSTSYSSDGYKEEDNNPDEATGYIYKGQDYAVADTEWIRMDLDADLQPAHQTVCMWANTDNLASYGTLYGPHWLKAMWLTVLSTEKLSCYVNGSAFSTNLQLTVGIWHHVCCKWDGDIVSVYLDGTSKETADKTDADLDWSGQSYVYEGGISTTYPFGGTMDEVRVSNIARSDRWIKFEYFNMGQSDNELSWGSEEASGSTIYTKMKGVQMKGVQIK